MPPSRLYVGPTLRRLRRDRGLTQADMATDLEISPSYIALLERNHRPLTAELLLRLAQTYGLDITTLAAGDGEGETARLQTLLKDPIFTDIDLPAMETGDLVTNFPGITEAFARLYTAYQEGQLALADQGVEARMTRGLAVDDTPDPVAESRRFLGARHNNFAALDEAGERLAQQVGEHDSMAAYFKARHGLEVRRLPPEVMVGSTRRLDWHHKAVLLDDEMDNASQRFQLAQQLAYLEMAPAIDAVIAEARFATESGERLTRRALAGYAAAAILLPYSAFARAVEHRRYDVEALARQFGASFEQIAHRLTTLQKPGDARVPFFFIRVDEAGNVSKRLDGAERPPRLPHAETDHHPVAGAAGRPAVLLPRQNGDRRRRRVRPAEGGPGDRPGLQRRARGAADLHPGRSGTIAGRRHADRSDLPAVPPGGVYGEKRAADRATDPAGRHPQDQRAVRVFG